MWAVFKGRRASATSFRVFIPSLMVCADGVEVLRSLWFCFVCKVGLNYYFALGLMHVKMFHCPFSLVNWLHFRCLDRLLPDKKVQVCHLK